MRCPDCSRQKTPTRSLQSIAVEPIATYVLIAINVAVFFGVQKQRPGATNDLIAASGRRCADGEGEYWRLVTLGLPAHGDLRTSC